MHVFYLSTNVVCDENRAWFEAFRSANQCTECGMLAPECRNGPVEVVVDQRPSQAALFAAHTPIGLGRVEFLRCFGEAFDRQFSIGQVVHRRGQRLAEMASFVPRRPIVIRSPDPKCWICTTCGRFLYDRFGESDLFYVTKESLGDHLCHGTDGSSLVVTHELYERIDRHTWKSLVIRQLPVLDHPLDGIDPFPENYY